MRLINKPEFLGKTLTKRIEVEYKALFVCDGCLYRNGRYLLPPVAYFFADEMHPDSKSHYFAVFKNPESKLVLTNGSALEDMEFMGAVAKNGDVIYSKHRHDHVISEDKTASIDGGRDYVRTNGCPVVKLKLEGSQLRIDRSFN